MPLLTNPNLKLGFVRRGTQFFVVELAPYGDGIIFEEGLKNMAAVVLYYFALQ